MMVLHEYLTASLKNAKHTRTHRSKPAPVVLQQDKMKHHQRNKTQDSQVKSKKCGEKNIGKWLPNNNDN